MGNRSPKAQDLRSECAAWKKISAAKPQLICQLFDNNAFHLFTSSFQTMPSDGAHSAVAATLSIEAKRPATQSAERGLSHRWDSIPSLCYMAMLARRRLATEAESKTG